jgi:hypothetical protein
MNKKIVRGGVAGIAVLALAAGGSTFAGWSDSSTTESGAGAGMLKLNVEWDESTRADNQPFSLAPGQNRYQYYFLASSDSDNTPTADLTVTLKDLVDTEDDLACTTNSERDAEGGTCDNPGELSPQTRYSFKTMAAPVSSADECPNADQRVLYSQTAQVAGGGAFAAGNLNNAPDKAFLLAEDLEPGQGVCMEVHMFMPEATATNASQGDDASFDLVFDLFQ